MVITDELLGEDMRKMILRQITNIPTYCTWYIVRK